MGEEIVIFEFEHLHVLIIPVVLMTAGLLTLIFLPKIKEE